MATNDPAAFFRDMLGQWEKMANTLGNDAMKTEGFARGLGGAQAAAATIQANLRDVTEKALAAANLPTKSDLDALTARVAGIEAALFRIEGKIDALGGTPAAPPTPAPRPTRQRKPPEAGTTTQAD